MAWLRGGDNAATHPIVMRVASLVRTASTKVFERDVAVNEVFGFAMRCAFQSAGHTTDYVVDEGTAWMIGGARTERLLDLAVKAGYMSRRKSRGVTTYLFVDDPLFIHMRTRAEIDWDRQRKADNANKPLLARIRVRDGDQCRYCGVIVNWRDRKGARGGTYDHREPGQPGRFETMVVCCFACNRSRSNDVDADERHPLRPEPTDPLYSADTAAFVTSEGHTVTVTEGLRPGSQPGNAHSDPAPSGTTRQPTPRRAPVTPSTSGAGSADHLSPESGFPGTGRVGTGSATALRSSNPAGTESSDHAGTRRRKRSARGRQPGPQPGASHDR